MMEKRFHELKIAERGAAISIVAYLAIAVLKIIIATMAKSEALRADGLNNTTDIIASLAVLIGLRLARRPPDDNHRYGHWRAETVASLLTSFIMLAVGLQVLITSVLDFFSENKTVPDPIAIYVGLFSAVVMFSVYFYNKRLAKKVSSGALMAAAKDNLNDAFTSIGTSIAILGTQFNLLWLDSVTAFIVGLLILKTAFEIFSDSAFNLSDGFDEDLLEQYKNTVLKMSDIEAVPSIQGRHYGSNIYVDITIDVDPFMSVQYSHDVTEQVETLLAEDFGVFEVDVHVEPFTEEI